MTTEKDTSGIKQSRYSVRRTPNNTCSIYDSQRGVTVLKSVTPQARYNDQVAEEVCRLLNSQ